MRLLARLASVSVLAVTTALGRPVLAGADDARYVLPAPAGTPILVVQGNDTGALGGDHTGASEFAYDFALAGDAPFAVTAARGGVVQDLRTDVPDGDCPTDGRCSPPPCWVDVDYVVIDHGDGTAGLYMHLAEGSSSGLSIGEPVAAGQVIGVAGTSGWTPSTRLHFMVMSAEPAASDTPWWRESIGPIAFDDPSVRTVHPDGIPGAGLAPDGPFEAGGPSVGPPVTPPTGDGDGRPAGGPSGRPLERPALLPARVPWQDGERLSLSSPPSTEGPDGFGLEVLAPPSEPDLAVYPLFGGRVVYAGCASGASAALGRIVVVERDLGSHRFQAVHGHLSSIEPPYDTAPVGSIEATVDAPIGRFGSSVGDAVGDCDLDDGRPSRLTVLLLRDASVSPDGEIGGGRPVQPGPLLGRGLYDGFAWWLGPMTAAPVDAAEGSPRVFWSRGTPTGAHVAYGEPVTLTARVRDVVDVQEVHFTAWYRDWPDERQAARLEGFDPRRDWGVLAVCRPPGVTGEPPTSRGCRWSGDAQTATVSFAWDPTDAPLERTVPWLPRATAAITGDSGACVPVTLGVEMVDAAGYRASANVGPIARSCTRAATSVGKVVFLDPPKPPEAPSSLSARILAGRITCDDASCTYPYRLSWPDGEGETGYHIYVSNLRISPSPECDAQWLDRRLLATVRSDTTSWDGRFTPDFTPRGVIVASQYYVAAYNDAGESPVTPSERVYYTEGCDVVY